MRFFKSAALALLFAAQSLVAESKSAGQPAPEWDKLFQRTNGWIGADGNYSVPLSDDTILWLFSDTWIGEVKDGKRVGPHLINNSIGIQRGTNPATASVDFFYGRDKNGKAEAFIKPKHGRGYFWLFGAAIESGYVWLAVIGVLNSAVSLYYYIRIVVYMMLKNEPAGSEPRQSPAMALAMGAAVVGTLVLGVYPQPLFEFAQASAATLGVSAIAQTLP